MRFARLRFITLRPIVACAVALAVFLVWDIPVDAQGLGGLEASRPGRHGPSSAVVDAKLKCGVFKDGSFGCKNVDKNKDNDGSGDNNKHKDEGKGNDKGKDKQQDDKAGKGNKCRGKNDCGPGFRDLDFPNKYGACCEAKSGSQKDEDKPKGNKCRGKNDCGPGFRDLDFPNKYGACCEAKTNGPKDDNKDAGNKDTGNKDTGKPKDEPKSGGCRSVSKMSEMSCTAPFGATSCSAMNNGKMTCCCVK